MNGRTAASGKRGLVYPFWKARLLKVERASDLHVPVTTITKTYTYRLIGSKRVPLGTACVRAFAMKADLTGFLIYACVTLFVTAPSIDYTYASLRDKTFDNWALVPVFFLALGGLLAPLFAVIKRVGYLQARTLKWSQSDREDQGRNLAIRLDRQDEASGLGGENGIGHAVVYWSAKELSEKTRSDI
jgi:hypothetical protein